MRGTGKTTRKIDEAIQLLFTNGKIEVPARQFLKDVVDNIDKLDSNIIIDEDWNISTTVQFELLKSIIKRLKSEHNNFYYDVNSTYITLNKPHV